MDSSELNKNDIISEVHILVNDELKDDIDIKINRTSVSKKLVTVLEYHVKVINKRITFFTTIAKLSTNRNILIKWDETFDYNIDCSTSSGNFIKLGLIIMIIFIFLF